MFSMRNAITHSFFNFLAGYVITNTNVHNCILMKMRINVNKIKNYSQKNNICKTLNYR